ncbi:glycosyltransferase [Lichenicola sp.]|uniref:glycosyltransferase n=1 Tax=Lichenicola sp. TaxID=2804529 RepID=UPI003AFFC189
MQLPERPTGDTGPEEDDAAELAALRFSLVRAGLMQADLRASLHRLQAEHRALLDRSATPIPAPDPMPEPEPELELELEPIAPQIAQLDADIVLLRQLLAAHQSSTIWRAPEPLRHVLGRRPGVARNGRRALKAVWWTLTLQWPARMRARSITGERARADPVAPAPVPPPIPGLDPAPDPRHPTDPAPDPQPPTDPPLQLPTAADPLVSVIVPSYGQVAATLRCLRAIAGSETETPFEVIVAEDASGDAEVVRLEQVGGLRLVCNATNLGFLHNCNEAALLARGRYLLFLNNDTEPLPGFLDALVRLAEAMPDAGLVGSKLLFPDGTLQEAGGIVWQDATGWNFGRGDDPSRPQYNTVRDTDYVSGASILLRRDLFETLGGFDPLFAPAYYEDTDLAFRIRARGLRVMYQPASVVVHHEGLSHGTDITSGIKARQEVNRHLMLARWPKLLAAEHFPSGTDVMRAREHAKGRRTILVIDHYVPEPDRDAGSRSTMGILNALRDAGWVVKFWPQNRSHNDYTHRLESIGIEVLDHRLPMGFADWLIGNGAELDHVMTMRPTVAVEFVSDLMRYTRAHLSFYGHDIHHVRMQRQAALTGDAALAAAAAEMARLERRLWGLFDVLLYLSETEAAMVREQCPDAVVRAVVGFSYNRFRTRGAPPAELLILFVAGFAHPPNIDAAQWLVTSILPLVRAEIPAAILVLAGSHPTAAVRALADGDRITVTGSLDEPELAALYKRARVAIVPLRAGAGVKGKVVEALQQGVPLVTTPIGAEGVPGLSELVPVNDQAAALANSVVTLLRDDRSWSSQSALQVAYAERHFSRAALAASLFAALEPSGQV